MKTVWESDPQSRIYEPLKSVSMGRAVLGRSYSDVSNKSQKKSLRLLTKRDNFMMALVINIRLSRQETAQETVGTATMHCDYGRRHWGMAGRSLPLSKLGRRPWHFFKARLADFQSCGRNAALL